MRTIAAGVLLVLLVAAILLERLPFWLAAVYPLLGVISAALYGFDKARAQNNGWRISEASLHLVDLCGGIIGGLLAQQLFRHKTAKPSFALVSFAIASLHGLMLAGLCVQLIGTNELTDLLAVATH